MLKREITYTDLEDEKQTDVFYFNLTKSELLEMEVDVEGGLGRLLQRTIDEKDNKQIVATIKQFILASYGVKSPDGKRFMKSDELRAEFLDHLAYEVLFTEFMLDSNKAAEFIEGILPKDLEEFNKKLQDQDKPKVERNMDGTIKSIDGQGV